MSRKPITKDEANTLRVDMPKEKWEGHARIVVNLFEEIMVPDYMIVERWGNVVVFGDPEVVRELVNP